MNNILVIQEPPFFGVCYKNFKLCTYLRCDLNWKLAMIAASKLLLILGDCSEYHQFAIHKHTFPKSGPSTIFVGTNYEPILADCTRDGWTVIQSRGQFNNSKDLFSTKRWEEYETGFGEPGIFGLQLQLSKSKNPLKAPK